ncbi:hypothetical protein ATY81_27575 [Rhizobium sp. R72]|nr:hypothetical protein ATY81_27575 [Rhizobium sp. R72]OWV96937.1 hypothetical protein ATY80_27575 [Rhizobium sp. R711]
MPTLMDRYGTPDLIFLTGDIAFSGKENEYLHATKFLDELLQRTGVGRDRLFVIPGNHDVDRTKGKGLARTLSSSDDADAYFDPSEAFPHIQHRQAGFLRWYNDYFRGIHTLTANSTCGELRSLNVNGRAMLVASLNSAAFSLDDNDHSKLWVGSRSLDRLRFHHSEPADTFRVALIHHPFDWLASGEQAKVRTAVRDFADVILSGHLHENNVEQVVGIHSGSAIQLQAGAAYQTKKWPNTAMFCRLDDSGLKVNPIKFSDSPVEVWVPDPSIFPTSDDFSRTFVLPRLAKSSPGITDVSSAQNAVEIIATETSAVQIAKADFEQDLFSTSVGLVLYAEPRLMRSAQEAVLNESANDRVSIGEIVRSKTSFLIEAKAEYGATSLSKRLVYELSHEGHTAVRKDARRLPNYRKKLEEEFQGLATKDGTATLILDNVVLENDERLIKEIKATGLFARIIAITVIRGLTSSLQPQILGEDAQRLYLWPMARDDVRSMACAVFSTDDQVFISRIVDKVYDDLLALCIPLTPPTVIMYLRVLNREGEFHPLNRVDILARYLDEVLRKPSDAYSESFNVKNKIDVVSAFVFHLYQCRLTTFDERTWHQFFHDYMEKTLTSFDASELLGEMYAARVFVKFGNVIFLRYSFFHDFLLGKYLASRAEALEEFLNKEDYYSRSAVIDVVTGISSDNTKVMEHLTRNMSDLLDQFTEKYFDQSFDPLVDAIWPDSSAEEALWTKVSSEIERGPKKIDEIDELKTSILAEARTADQQVRYLEFARLERNVFTLGRVLADALMNSHDVNGSLKLAALDGVLKSFLVSFQVGCALAPLLAAHRYFRWGGIAFLDFHTVKDDEDESRTVANVTVSLAGSIAQVSGDILGSNKLAALFRARQKTGVDKGIVELMNFHCILASKGADWPESLKEIIIRTDKNAYYLNMMLHGLMSHLRNEVIQAKDRESVKWLIAMIQSKRVKNKQTPGAKLVKRFFDAIEREDGFDVVPTEG